MICFVTTCKGRTQHLRDTLPRNMRDNPNSKFIVLDYNSQDDLLEYLRSTHGQEIHDGRLVVYSYRDSPIFHMSHAKNLAARLGILEGADILVTMDADNYSGPGFEDFILANLTRPRVFLCPDFPRIKSLPHGPDRPARGYAGRLAIRVQDFLKLGGYDETFDTWRGEDMDLIARIQRIGGFVMKEIPIQFLHAIPHNSRIRFREYPHAQQFENSQEYHNIRNRTETVVNFGRFGCGVVFRNFDFSDPCHLAPIPTRIFGIGMHKTATTSLHDAFKLLGYDSFHWETNRRAWEIWNEMTRLGRSTTVERYYSLCDNPIPFLFKELDRAYPGSKFILTTRDEASWLGSVQGLFDPKVNPHYDWDRQPFSHQIHHALYGRTDFDESTMMTRYRQHNADVLAHFVSRPSDLLLMPMDQGAGWSELCNFLGNVPLPSVPYPKSYAAY